MSKSLFDDEAQSLADLTPENPASSWAEKVSAEFKKKTAEEIRQLEPRRPRTPADLIAEARADRMPNPYR